MEREKQVNVWFILLQWVILREFSFDLKRKRLSTRLPQVSSRAGNGRYFLKPAIDPITGGSAGRRAYAYAVFTSFVQ